jgi:uncharacterized RDD family membrane protein YckC
MSVARGAGIVAAGIRNEHRVLTPESVEFVYELAGLGSRMVAALVDHLLILAFLVGIWAAVLLLSLFGCLFTGGLLLLLAGGPMVASAILASFVVYFGYFVYWDHRANGQTPGKRLVDIRVIDDRGMNLDLFQSVIRNLLRLVDMAPFLLVVPGVDFISVGLYAIGGLAAFASPLHKRLGDWAAGTLVIRTRKRVPPEAVLPPEEKYNTIQDDAALRARIRGRLNLEERETLLQLCLRRHELEFEARQALFAETAALLESRLDLPREPFLSEEKFVQNIAAVALAERAEGAPRPAALQGDRTRV